MSRIDEALRRAAKEVSGSAAAPALPPTGIDAAAVATEPFPAETDEPETSPAPPPDAATLRLAQEPAPATVVSTGPESEPLLERVSSQLPGKVVVDRDMSAVGREQYRRLAGNLHHAQLSHNVRVVMITSAVAGEGKTLTCSNLALTLSESYKRHVLLIDADLRRPSVHTLFGVDNSTGLHEGLSAVDERKLPVRQVSSHLCVLPAGRPSSDPMAGLTSPRMRRLLEEARAVFDWVIIDTPPVALLADANLLASMVDRTLIVVKAGATSYPLVQKAADTIGRERTFGVVLNRASAAAQELGYGYYDEYYAYSNALDRATGS